MGIRAPGATVEEHAEALWAILGPDCFEVFPDALEALQVLRRSGVPLAVVSNWQSGLRHFCTELGLAQYVDHVVSSADFGVQKPDRRIFLEACGRLGVPPERTLHVGDTYVDDYVGGQAAGLQVLLIDRSGKADAGAAHAVRSLVDLVDVVMASESGDTG
jgi:HAD superfamily hydrolase (TIGR01549 family)